MPDISQMGLAELAGHMAKMEQDQRFNAGADVEELAELRREINAATKKHRARTENRTNGGSHAEPDPYQADPGVWLTISDDPWDVDKLPPRPWLAEPYFMRGEMTLLHGPGAAGKSQLLVAWAVALALGRGFGRLQPRRRSRVLLTNFEDNAIEQKRRISAMLTIFDATPEDLKGWLFRVSLGKEGDATMFKLDERGQVTGTDCWEALKSACETIHPDAVAFDPLVAVNAVPENDNQLMRRVMTMIRLEIGQHCDAAIGIAHHDNKSGGDGEDSDQTNARGGGDIVNGVRFEIQTKKMTSQQADGWGLDTDKRGFYFRAGSAASKRNYTAPEESEWFERLTSIIAGEEVVFCVPWTPPGGALTDDQSASLLAAIERGTPDGPYSPQLGNTSRSLSPVLEALGITTPKAQRDALNRLLRARSVVKAEWCVIGDRFRAGLRSKDGLPYNWKWRDSDHD